MSRDTFGLELSTAQELWSAREHFLRFWKKDGNAARSPYLGLIIGPVSESTFAELKTMPSRMADAASPRRLRFRAMCFNALCLSSTFGPSDAEQTEFNLGQAQHSNSTTLPALLGFNEALASFDVDIPGFRADAIIMVGNAYRQDPTTANAIAQRLKARGTKLYGFQEGDDALAAALFKHLAAMTGGRYMKIGAPLSLEELCMRAAQETTSARSAKAAS